MNTKTILKGVLPVVILAGGFGLMKLMIATKPEAERRPQQDEALLVEVVEVHATQETVTLTLQGQLLPARQVVLVPEVGGRVQSMSENLVPGGRFAQGETMLRVDGRDYRLAVDSRGAEVNRAELELQLEQGRQVVAQREWQAFGAPEAAEGGSEQGRALALRQPQVETAEVGVRSARSAIQQARLNLQRTTLRAPFNAMVMMENVDVGQLIGPSSQVATLVGTDEFWARVSVPVAQLAHIRFPDRDGEGSPAVVWQMIGGQRVQRAGRVVRLLPDVDPIGSMARVLIAIEDPLALAEDNDSLPMLLGSFVQVEIAAGVLEDVIEVPRFATRDGNRVFVMGSDSKLEIRPIDVAWSREDSVLVRASSGEGSGLRAGERIVTSRVPTPVAGLPLRVAEAAPQRAAADGAGDAAEATP